MYVYIKLDVSSRYTILLNNSLKDSDDYMQTYEADAKQSLLLMNMENDMELTQPNVPVFGSVLFCSSEAKPTSMEIV